jgi:phosphopantetheine binding protein
MRLSRNNPKHQTAKQRSGPNWRVCSKNRSGIDVAGAPPGTSFLELGFDSLFLTQASQAIKIRFNAAVSFRQMLGELATVDAVAGHLHQVAENFVVEATPAARSQIEASPSTPPGR